METLEKDQEETSEFPEKIYPLLRVEVFSMERGIQMQELAKQEGISVTIKRQDEAFLACFSNVTMSKVNVVLNAFYAQKKYQDITGRIRAELGDAAWITDINDIKKLDKGTRATP